MKYYIFVVSQFGQQAMCMRTCEDEAEAQLLLDEFIKLSNSGVSFYITVGKG